MAGLLPTLSLAHLAAGFQRFKGPVARMIKVGSAPEAQALAQKAPGKSLLVLLKRGDVSLFAALKQK